MSAFRQLMVRLQHHLAGGIFGGIFKIIHHLSPSVNTIVRKRVFSLSAHLRLQSSTSFITRHTFEPNPGNLPVTLEVASETVQQFLLPFF